MEIWFPGLKIPGITIRQGLFLDTFLLGFAIVVPPWDIVLWEEKEIWKSFKIFDIAWVVDPILTAMATYFPDAAERLKTIWSDLLKTAETVAKIFEELGKDPIGTISKVIEIVKGAILGYIWGWVDGALRWATDTFRWLRNEIGDDISRLQDSFDDTVLGPILDMWNDLLEKIPKAVWDLFESTLDEMVREYYERSSEE